MADHSTTEASKARSNESCQKREPDLIKEATPRGIDSGILGLQRSVGNQVVGHLLRSSEAESVQGTGRNAGPLIQAKLTVSHPHDHYEQEADRVADQVMRMHDTVSTGTTVSRQIHQPTITRKCARCNEELNRSSCSKCAEEDQLQAKSSAGQSVPSVSSGLEGRINSLRRGGTALPDSVRSNMESRFGHDFSRVRVHTGSVASETTQAVKARAFTLGSSIAFAPGQYSPGTSAGQRLLAHELTHVVQQGGANSRTNGSSSERPGVQPISRLSKSSLSRSIIQRGVAAGCYVKSMNANDIGTHVHNQIGAACAVGFPVCTPNRGIARRRRRPGRTRRTPTRPDLLRVQPGSTHAELGEIKPNSWRSGSKYSAIRAELTRKIAQYRRTNPTMTASSMTSVTFPPMPLTLDPRQTIVTLGPVSGLYFYRCIGPKAGKKKKKKQPKKKAKPKPKPKPKAKPKAKVSKKAIRKLAKPRALKKLRNKIMKGALKASRRALLKGGLKIAGKLAARFIPVVGWLLLAVDIAEAAYNISKYGLNFGGGEGGEPGGEAEGEGTQGGTAEAAGEGSAEGGTAGSGTAEGGSAEGTAEKGAAEGEKEGAEGEGTGEAEAKEGTAAEGGSTEGGESKGAEAEGGKAEGTADPDLAELSDIFDDEEVQEIVDALPLSDQLIEALKASTPEQQGLLNLMLERVKDPNAPRVTEDFFMKLLELSKDLTAEELERLSTMTRPAQGESADDILKKLKEAIAAAKQGKSGAPASDSTGKPPAKSTDKPAQEGSSGETPKTPKAGGESTGEGTSKKKKSGPAGPPVTTPRPYEGDFKGTFNFHYESGLPTNKDGALTISQGQVYEVTVRFTSAGKTYRTVVPFKVGPVGDTTVPGTRITLTSTNKVPWDVAPDGDPPFIIKVQNELVIEVVGG